MKHVIEGADGALVTIDGREFVSFAGCDSLGLARHPEVVEAAREALGRCGVSAAASRTTTGTWRDHERLEATLASYMGAESAVVFASGWLACQSVVRVLAQDAHAVMTDAGAHPGVRDAAALSGRDIHTYAHFDTDDAERTVEPLVGAKPLLVTCTIELATGAVASLAELAQSVADVAGSLVVDDAHGVGVLGESGRGAAEHCGATGDHVFVTGTLSKAFGAQGGFFAGTRATCDAVRAAAPAYAGATGLPPAIAAAAARAVEIAADGSLRALLLTRCRDVSERFVDLGLSVPATPVPWMALHAETETELRRIEASLANAGLLVPHVRYHGAPEQGYLRVAISAAHTAAHIEALGDAVAQAL